MVKAPAVKAPDLERAARLRNARARAGHDGPAAAARALGISAPTYHAHENGSRGISATAGQLYARRFRVSFEWLMLGKDSAADKSKPASGHYSLLHGLVQYPQDVPLVMPERPGATPTAIVRRLLSRTADTITLRQFSPDIETSISTAKVQRISKILTTADLAGV